MSDENQNKVYNLLISKGIDSYNEYDFYKERINSQKEFKWNEYNTQDNELNDDLFEKIDVIVLLYGLYHQNKEICDELIDKSKEYGIPLLFIRSFGVEYVIETFSNEGNYTAITIDTTVNKTIVFSTVKSETEKVSRCMIDSITFGNYA